MVCVAFAAHESEWHTVAAFILTVPLEMLLFLLYGVKLGPKEWLRVVPSVACEVYGRIDGWAQTLN